MPVLHINDVRRKLRWNENGIKEIQMLVLINYFYSKIVDFINYFSPL